MKGIRWTNLINKILIATYHTTLPNLKKSTNEVTYEMELTNEDAFVSPKVIRASILQKGVKPTLFCMKEWCAIT